MLGAMPGPGKTVWWLAAALTVSVALPARAHAHLLRTTPADGSSIAASPPQLQLVFTEAVTLTALSIQKNADPAPLRLAPLPRQPAAVISIAMPRLTPGSYLVKWCALSDDHHMASGSIRFTLQAR